MNIIVNCSANCAKLHDIIKCFYQPSSSSPSLFTLCEITDKLRLTVIRGLTSLSVLHFALSHIYQK